MPDDLGVRIANRVERLTGCEIAHFDVHGIEAGGSQVSVGTRRLERIRQSDVCRACVRFRQQKHSLPLRVEKSLGGGAVTRIFAHDGCEALEREGRVAIVKMLSTSILALRNSA